MVSMASENQYDFTNASHSIYTRKLNKSTPFV